MNKLITYILVLFLSIDCQAQRNTILIIADDLSPDYFGFYEGQVDTVAVPHIRSLLAKGIRFKNFTSNPVCSSTRTTILTGRYSFRTGVGGIVGGVGGSNQIDTAEISIPKLLKIHNPMIAKANIGKWHLKQPTPAINLTSPLALGFDFFQGPFIGQLPSYTNWTKYTNGSASTVTNYATSENVNDALAWLQTLNSNQPFFLWLAFNSPHEPLHLPPPGLHTYTNLNGTPANINVQPKAYFKAMIQAMDHEIGRLFDSLQSINKLDSTDFIFIGDNGNTARTAQISDLTKAKGTVYEYGVHVPLIIAGPSVVNKGRVSNALVNSVDLFATIVENFGYYNWQTQIPNNKTIDSKSLQPIIKNQIDSIRPWSFCEIFKLTSDSSDGKAMKNKDYKLIRFDYGAEEFYNIAFDSLESHNLLLGVLTPQEKDQYYDLCNKMTGLVGGINFCLNQVDVQTINDANPIEVYPNPFIDFIHLKNKNPQNLYKLSNCLGQTIFLGNFIENENFAHLPKGLYFLTTNGEQHEVIKLEKTN